MATSDHPLPPPPLESIEHSHPPGISTLERTLPFRSAAWVLYDSANTVYAAVLTYIFFPYIGELFDARAVQGITNSLSMVAAALMVPLFASLADHTGRARMYLIVTSLGCIGGLALFGVSSVPFVIMALFFVANVGYNAALTFYNALLPSVASDRHQGLVSGFGVGLGYIGTLLIVLLVGLPDKVGYPMTFMIAAGLFLVMALPCFVFVNERRVLRREKFTGVLVRRQFSSVITTVKELPRNKPLMWFFLGNFFCVDVLNTAIIFFGDFTRSTFFVNVGTRAAPVWEGRGDLTLPLPEIVTAAGVYTPEITTPGTLLMVAGLLLNSLALMFGILLGFLTDRVGALQMLRLSALFLVFGLFGAAAFAGVHAMLYLLVLCGFGGLGLAGIWTAGRKLLIELAPREKLGEYFGLYGITLKLSVIGSAVFGIIYDVVYRLTDNDLTGWKVALSLQAVPLALGITLLMLVRHPGKQVKPAA
jgi:MFS transporter, UMF1 family